MTKKEFLKRCETIYDMGFVKNRDMSVMLRLATDTFMRLRSCYASHPEMFEQIKNHYHGSIAVDNLGMYFNKNRVLAADTDVYNAEMVACIIDHPCQACAEDRKAWHTRYGFCSHKEYK